jgi:hypothetical protein
VGLGIRDEWVGVHGYQDREVLSSLKRIWLEKEFGYTTNPAGRGQITNSRAR